VTRAIMTDASGVPVALAPTPGEGSVIVNVLVVLLPTLKPAPLNAQAAIDAVPALAGGQDACDIFTAMPFEKPCGVDIVTVAVVPAGVAVGEPVDVPAVTPLTA